MVISVVVAEYKVERVLIDQGSSTNILYWSIYKKLGLKLTDMEPYVGKLYGFAGEHIQIKGLVELNAIFGERGYTRTISVSFMVVDVKASYNIIIGRPALNKLGVVVSTYHLCMKYPVEREVGRVWADHNAAKRCYEDNLRVGSRPSRIGDTDENQDVFAWPSTDMPGVDPEFICHHLSISPGFRPVAQRWMKLGDEKRRAAKEETKKLFVVGFIREIQYPTWLANMVMVKKANVK
ncbi:hypothetical protein CR513_01209, partial [Mucuna pruriens]